MRNRCTNHLKNAKIRASWNKYNLYNLSRAQIPNTTRRTFFQQKWIAKSVCRAYHGEQVREGQWEKMFSRRVRSVVPMKARYLAFSDGGMESSGRGSGFDQVPKTAPPPTPEERKTLAPVNFNLTPYSNMTFAPLERRLDVAVFRALFASSARQARQFVIHGAVTVNGKKMQYPGYLLNPGDMFQVDPERVMFATGAPKDSKERRAGRIRKRMGAKENKDESAEKDKENKKDKTKEKATTQGEEPEDSRAVLKGLLSQAKSVMAANKGTLPAKRKQDIRGFQSAVRRVLSRSSSSTVLMENLEAQFSEIKTMLEKHAEEDKAKAAEKKAAAAAAAAAAEQAEGASAQASAQPPKKSGESSVDNVTEQLDQLDVADYSRGDLDVLRKALQELQDNPIDSSKPYATPWRPRDYMSAFACIPRYLEVNQNICAAVYLRHPVARPGQSEVPSPHAEKIATLAYNWYLRRR